MKRPYANLDNRIVPFSRYVAFAAWTHVKQGELPNPHPNEPAGSPGTPGDRAMTPHGRARTVNSTRDRQSRDSHDRQR